MASVLLTDPNSLEKYIPLCFQSLSINKSYYSFILNEHGGIIDDIIISVITIDGNENFYIVYNSSRKNIDEKIFKSVLEKFKILTDNSLVAVQGPLSEQVLDYLKIDFPSFFMNNITFKLNERK